jgi:hypothetical protein
MTTTILKLTATMLIVAGAFACTEKEDQDTLTGLAGTKWKLEGLVNEQTSAMQVLEPTDCQQCYTLEFDTDTIGTGMTTTNQMYFNVNTLPPFITVMTEINEMNDDGHFFVQILSYIRNFEHQNDTLKFFYQYQSTNYYLLFIKLSQ